MQTLIRLKVNVIYNIPANIAIRNVDGWVVFGNDSKNSIEDTNGSVWAKLLDMADTQALALNVAARNI